MSLFAPIVSALVVLLALAIILSSHVGNKIQDIPNERSLHAKPIPRVGGVGLMAGVLVGWLLVRDTLVWWLSLPLAVLFSVSLLDDACGLLVRQRLATQLVASSILVFGSGFFPQQGIVAAGLLLLAIVWMTNLYNFMDGSNGLAGGMALFGFAAYGVAAFLAHNEALAILNFCISAAALGFLFYNFHPARVFMGDAGSIPLGFLAAAMGLWGWQQGCWPAWFPLLVFSPFIVDATVTLIKRALNGEKVWQAHCSHYYQRLVQMGWGHRKTALWGYAMMMSSGASAVCLLEQPSMIQFMGLAGWMLVYLMVLLNIDRMWMSRIL